MIECVSGDFFDHEADIRVNTVNCVGIMGAGVALEFKRRYPEMFLSYVEACEHHELAPGRPHLWENNSLFGHCLIVNLPTKLHWRDPSKYEYIEQDLVWLRDFLLERDAVVTLPALGCGHGGLDWSIVKPKIYHYLSDVKAKVLLFEPSASNKDCRTYQREDLLQSGGIQVLYPDSPHYPAVKGAPFARELYCKGNLELLNWRRLGVICSNAPSERELSAIGRIVCEFAAENRAVVLALNNKQHLNFALRLLSRDIKIILVLPEGIHKYKYDADLKNYSDRFLILSYTAPDQGFTRYSYINSLKYRCGISDAILYAGENLKDVQRDVKYLNRFPDLFYVNYWPEKRSEFSAIGARKIGIDPETGRPNVKALLRFFE